MQPVWLLHNYYYNILKKSYVSLQLLWENPNFFVTQALNIYRLKDVVIKWTYIGTGMCWKLHRRSHIIGSMLKSIFKSSGQKGGHICH